MSDEEHSDSECSWWSNKKRLSEKLVAMDSIFTTLNQAEI